MTTSSIENPFLMSVRKEANHLIWLGVAFLLVGAAALIFPMVSTLVATVFVAWLLIFSGVATLFASFSIRQAGPFFGALLTSLLSLATGVLILLRPGVGELGITISLGALFMIQGAFEMALAFDLRPTKGWGWLAFSALSSIVLSLAIAAGLPGSSLVTLGIIIGVNFITTGVAYLSLGGAVKREAHG